MEDEPMADEPVEKRVAERGQACGNCRFWKQSTGGEPRAGWGQCRRMPPTLPDLNDEKLVHVGVWPHTDVADWCGEWQAG